MALLEAPMGVSDRPLEGFPLGFEAAGQLRGSGLPGVCSRAACQSSSCSSRESMAKAGLTPGRTPSRRRLGSARGQSRCASRVHLAWVENPRRLSFVSVRPLARTVGALPPAGGPFLQPSSRAPCAWNSSSGQAFWNMNCVFDPRRARARDRRQWPRPLRALAASDTSQSRGES